MTTLPELTMTHEGGKERTLHFLAIIGKNAQFTTPGTTGTYFFKLSNGECKEAENWYIEGQTLNYARQQAKEAGVKYKAGPRIPLRHKGKDKKPRKKRAPKVCDRTVSVFDE